MKKILILYPHFPPSNLAGVHRPRLFAQHLPAFGWQPTILTVHEDYYEEAPDWNLLKLLPKDLRIEKVKAFKLTRPRLRINNIIVHEPLPQKELHTNLSKYDVGLALESQKYLNNDLVISNKMLGYLLAGIYILGSKTTTQKKYLKQNVNIGITVDNIKNKAVKKIISNLVENKNLIRNLKIERFN